MRWASGRALATAILIAAAALLAYAGGLSGPFVFDDRAAIADNASIRSAWPPWRALRGPAQGNALAGRPLANYSFALSRAGLGPEPARQRAVNLALHVGCAWLAAVALALLLAQPRVPEWLRARGPAVSGATGSLFAVHPLASEVVYYAVQRTEVLAALFSLAAFACALRSLDARRPGRWQVPAVGACAAALLCKESAAALPLVALGADRAFAAGSLRAALAARGRFYLALAATLAIPLAASLAGSRGRSVELFSPAYLAAQGEIVFDYALHAVVPRGLVADYGPLVAGSASASAAAALALTAALGALWIWRAPKSGFAALWWFGWLAPTSSLVAVLAEVGAERRAYLPLLAPIALASLAAARLDAVAADRSRISLRGRRAFWAFALATAAWTLCSLTGARSADYASERSFWQAAAAARPANPRAWFNLGNRLREEGDASGAVLAYLRSLAADETYDAQVNLGSLLARSGEVERGLAHLERAAEIEPLELHPHDVDARANLALVLASLGRRSQALEHVEVALERAPSPRDRLRVAEILATLGERNRALRELDPLFGDPALDPVVAEGAAELRLELERAP
jgi:tetratricopeptide (TPR) repeat protein